MSKSIVFGVTDPDAPALQRLSSSEQMQETPVRVEVQEDLNPRIAAKLLRGLSDSLYLRWRNERGQFTAAK